MPQLNSETVDLSVQGPVDTPPTAAGLLLGFGGGPARGVERRRLPAEGVLLGRGALVFGGGPLIDGRISRKHAEIRKVRGKWTLTDLRSRNGTRLNGASLSGPAALTDGDIIRVGDTLLVFTHLDEAPPAGSELVGDSAALAAVRRSLSAVAPHPHAVLLQGQTGTGKEVVARALHRLSARRGAFVAINCAAVAEGLFESELFGHSRGAFTGAERASRGLLRSADGGTLFLDEIGELPVGLQGKLLRALETGAIRPVGEAREVAVDVRVVAATNRDLVQRIREDAFRSDLFARLAQWTVTLPPLSERRADIPALCRHLLAGLGVPDFSIDAELGEALLLHPWPLNVRGLRNVLSAAVIGCTGTTLRLTAEVSAALQTYQALAEPAASREEAVEPSRAELEALLRAHGGSVAAIARKQNASRQQVYRWMKRHSLDPADYR